MATQSAAQSPNISGRKEQSSTGDTTLDSKAPTLLEEKGITSPLPGLSATDGKYEDGVDNSILKSATPTLSDEKGTVPTIASGNGEKRNTTPGSAADSLPHEEDKNDTMKEEALEDDTVYPSGLALGFIVIALVLTIFLVRSRGISSAYFNLLTDVVGLVRYDHCCNCHSKNYGRIQWN